MATELTRDQLECLVGIIRCYGRGWKRCVRIRWYASRDSDQVLMQLRNVLGPSGLERLTTRDVLDQLESKAAV